MDPFEMRLITHAAMSAARDLVGDRLATDSWNWLFVCGINVGNNNTVCIIKVASEFETQRFGSRKTMRLEHRQHAFAPGSSRPPKIAGNVCHRMILHIHPNKTTAH